MWTFRVVPSLFLRDMYRALSIPHSEVPPRTPHYSPMLHNAILSVSLAFSDEPYLRDPKTRLCFATAAKSLHELHAYTKADLSTVQAMGFLSSFYSDFGERIPAELYVGMSSRLGMILGLGLDATPWAAAGLIETDEIRWRNWTHWTLFCLDATWALYLGWDLGGPSRRSIQMPFVDSDMDQNPWYYAPANIPPQPNYLTLVFFETSVLFVIARQISELVHNSVRRNATQVEKQIAKIDLELNNWKRQLPPQLDITLENRASSTPQRLMLHLTYWWCSLALHRPFFDYPVQRIRHSDSEVNHAKLCIHAAENILELVETWSSLYTLRLAVLTMQGIIFSAGTVFLLCALQATAGPRIDCDKLQAILAQVQTCTRYLHEMGGTWPSAARTGNMLQAILNNKIRPVIVRRLAHTGMQIFVATLDREIPPAPGMDEGNETGLPAEAAPSYVPEWDLQLDPARGWSKPPLDNFFEQIQNAPVAFGLGVQTSLASMGAAADFRTLTTSVHQNV
ncbi:Zn(2)-C6 fungal-type domain-containing protein [Mycena venus]|uniref:Zn(2)-C6 fungal-type domain-containing protein n=1 Tax=Mycena venus TaxID=2733690 RepID=A0A8H7D5X6_9AGAR|nr:Zn(2)-C6 fungal-type domain-containing protein [Mycena venus]